MPDEPPVPEFELWRRQCVIDAQWEKTLAEREHRREQAERRSFHRAPGDTDWDIK